MPWSGGTFTRTNGVHTGSTLWVQDRDAGTKILAARHDTHDQDLADGINATLEKSGSNAATGNLDIGSNRITLVADGTAKTDAATVNQIQSNGAAFQATDSGSADAYAIALSPAVTAYAAGQTFTFKAANASTGASTLDVNTLGVKTLKKLNDQDIAAGDIESGSIVTVVYDGTNFQVTSQLATTAATSPGGSDTQVQYNSSSAFAGSANFTFDGTSATVGGPFILPDGAVGAPALTNTGDLDTGVYFPAADQLGVVVGGEEKVRFGSNPFTGRNLLINGDMRISQRGTLTDQGGSNLTGTACDRWVTFWSAGTEQARFTTSQDTTVLAGSGFANSLKVDCTTAESAVAAGEGEFILQSIEGQNCQHLLYGNAAARSLTLSFDFRSPKSGTHCVALVQPDAARSYVAEFTVAGADTMEHFSLTIAGDTSGTINDDTGAGLRVVFPLIAGSNLQAAAGAWAAGTDYATSNQQNLLDNTANNIYITGVQLEVGEVATAFEHRGVAEELALCQRYFWRQTRLAGNTDTHIVTGYCDSTTGVEAALRHPTTMRSSASMTVSAVDDFYIRHRAANTATNGVTDADFGPFAGMLIFTVASGLTAGEGCVVALQTNGDWIEFTSEM